MGRQPLDGLQGRLPVATRRGFRAIWGSADPDRSELLMAHAQQAWSQASVRALVMACAIASVCVAGSPVQAVQAAKGRVALIVNKANTISEFSSADLRRILVGEITRWPGSSKITLLLLPPGSEERRAIVRTITGMSDD